MLNKKISIAIASLSAFIVLSAASLQQVPQQGAPGQAPQGAPGPQGPPPAPQKYTNLKVLSKKISNQELRKLMGNYNASLGVNCGYCHVAKPTPTNPNARDYASDAKPEKEMARHMIKMTEKINKKYFANGNGGAAIVAIDCYTCHGGKKEPINVAPAPARPPGAPAGPGAPAAPGTAPAAPSAPARG